jgi:hypothetical protein
MDKEELLFKMFKDEKFKNTESLKSKIGSLKDNIDFTKLYKRIINYQIDKYGEQLCAYEKQGIDYEHTLFTKINPL